MRKNKRNHSLGRLRLLHPSEPMAKFLSKLTDLLPFSGYVRQLEQETETVIKVLQPGPLGIVEHKFSAKEILEAKTTVARAVENWRRNAILEKRNNVLKEYIN